MVPTSNEPSRETDVEARERLTDLAITKLAYPDYKGQYWCHERKQFFNFIELITYKYS